MSDGKLEFCIDEKDMDAIEKMLGNASWKMPTILKDSVNATAKQARENMLQKAKEKYAVKSGKFRGKSKIKGATYNNPVAVINISGQVNEIRDFRATPASVQIRRKSAAKGKVLTSSSLKPLQTENLKAFVAKFKSGHVAVVQRVPGKLYTRGSAMSERMKKYGKSADMTKIKKLLSPSLPKIIGGEEGIYNELSGNIQSMLSAHLHQNIEKFMRGES